MTFLFSPALPAPLYDYLCSLLQETLAPAALLQLLLLHVAVGRNANVQPRTMLYPVDWFLLCGGFGLFFGLDSSFN